MNEFTDVGIDQIHMYTPQYYLDLSLLAKANGLSETAYTRGISQTSMSVAPPDEDIVTMAASAAKPLLVDNQTIDMLIFATESGVDQSKSAGTFVHQLLGLSHHCRVFEIKQACYAATAALHLACDHVRVHPNANVLVVASDIAKYAPKTPAEASQGAGAVAFTIKANPRTLALDQESGCYTEDQMDFWRPPYQQHAFVDGKHSCELYFKLLDETWQAYQQQSGRHYHDHHAFCYHTPVPKLALKAHKWLAKHNAVILTRDQIDQQMLHPLAYHRQIGNTYTASLYISLLSLLDNSDEDLTGKRLGFYSYGSGCVAEFFSGTVQPGYAEIMKVLNNKAVLTERSALDYQQYANWNGYRYVEDGSHQVLPQGKRVGFRLTQLNQHKRAYEAVADA